MLSVIRLTRFFLLILAFSAPRSPAAEFTIQVAGQPLAANVRRVLQTLEFLGAPLPPETLARLQPAIQTEDSEAIQLALASHILLRVQINPETRLKVTRGPAPARLQQNGYTPILVQIINQSTSTQPLRITSPQAGQRFGGMTPLSAQRMQRTERNELKDPQGDPARFLELELASQPPMTDQLSGLELEYAIALIYSARAGKLEGTIGFDLGQQNQDLGFRGEVPILFDVRPAVKVRLQIHDENGLPTAARLVFRDAAGHVFPPQAKRLAPDFYFQDQVYRSDGSEVLLPPGPLDLRYSRGPEYRLLHKRIEIPDAPETKIALRLERWINPSHFGFYSGDHHIHGAGCAHYTSPTEGVTPDDMFLQVKGEGLNVGCILTWGPCFEYQRQFFAPAVHPLSEPFTVLKYDLEISGFGSEALGHVCLLNLKDQTYPGSDGTKTKGWPTWTTPVMRWAKSQGGVTGYAHSASGLQINPPAAAKRLVTDLDTNLDGALARNESEQGLLPAPFDRIDADQDSTLIESELTAALDRAADQLPNLAVPEMNSVGAMEICVSTVAGVCDFISAMDTARIPEWNMWYHILNCGFPLKVSGETDFPCMSGDRVGQGRVYVHLGQTNKIDFARWCLALAQGRSYVSDGFAHALSFTVNDVAPGHSDVLLGKPAKISVRAKVSFAPETPKTVAQGTVTPPGGNRFAGDTVTLHAARSDARIQGGTRRVEIIANSLVVASRDVPADGQIHDLEFEMPIAQSSWIALRQFPQLHTNPVNVLVDNQPIRASRSSALWCAETIKQLWRIRHQRISEAERPAAQQAFDHAIRTFQRIAAESPAP